MLNGMSQKIVFIMLAFFSAARIFSQDSDNETKLYENAVITHINFEGLKRTKESFMRSSLAEFINQKADRATLNQATLKLDLEGLFKDITVSYHPISANAVSMDVSVKEKFSFLPVPFVMYTSDTGVMGGAAVLDMNAFGVKDMVLASGAFSKNQIIGMFMYAKQPKGWTPGFLTMMDVGKRANELTDMSGETVLEYDSLTVEAEATITEKIGKYNAVSLGGSFTYLNADDDGGSGLARLDPMIAGGVSLDWSASTSEANEYFMSKTGIGANAEFLFTNDADFPAPKNFSFSALVQKPIAHVSRLRLCVSLAGLYGIKNPISSLSGREAGSVTILPSRFKTERIFGGQAGVELAMVRATFGVISLYANYEAVVAQDFSKSFCFNQGLGYGAKFYLSRMAFPALAVGVSYNATQNSVQCVAAFGMSF